jgi:hypothetical protein
MALADLTEPERDLVRQCLVALRHGRYLDEDDIESRIGVAVGVYDALLGRWPEVDDRDDDSDECLVINNALNEVCHGVHIPPREWERWFTAPRETVLSTYRHWALARGWDHTGIR